TYASFTRGGESGKSPFVARSSKNSRVMHMLTGKDESPMPPEDEPQPTAKEIALMAAWIDAGAVGPKESKSAHPTFETIAAADAGPSAVTSIDWSDRFIAISRYRSITILDASSGEILKTLSDFPGKINSIRFSNDGKRLVVASGVTGFRGDASIWDTSTFELISRIQSHNDTLFSAVESPDGKLIATASYDRMIKLWNASDQSELRTLIGHNDAIYDLDFSQTGEQLISAGGDQTIKVWQVATGKRLDTLGQPLQEQFACRFSPNGQLIVGGGRDNRIRVWKFVSRDNPQINPLRYARFAHEAPIVALDFSPDGKRLVSTAEDRTIKIWETDRFTQVGTIPIQSDVCVAVAFSPNSQNICVGRLDGSTDILPNPKTAVAATVGPSAKNTTPTAQANGDAHLLDEMEPNDEPQDATFVDLPCKLKGRIHGDHNDADLYRFDASKGQRLVVEVRAARDKSPLDSRIEILDTLGNPVPRVVLRAVRDSYFTFRGKDSKTHNDFRIHNWQEMGLNDYLYSNGEVVKLFLHPRGPDSGFVVYPGSGSRTNFFGTTAMSHALHEPCYVVRPYPVGTEFQPNGLPTFELNYENDDDSLRKLGTDSRLMFVAPDDGAYLARVTDSRGQSGENYRYQLDIRSPEPDFSVRLSHPGSVHKGSGQEFSVTANRVDGFDGPIQVHVEDVPKSLRITTPLTIEAGHNVARGTIHWHADVEAPTQDEIKSMRLYASSVINGEPVERDVRRFGKIKFTDKPKVQLRVLPYGKRLSDEEHEQLFSADTDEIPTYEVAAGSKIELRVIAWRNNHGGRISFGNEFSGRNLPHGVYVDDIGLNGLMITAGNREQRFFITAESWVQPTTHTFHVKANDVENQATWPVKIKVTR
ncbi:MAG: WD40 repeat domain-containing protein, partial [Planctomycetota bacterium]